MITEFDEYAIHQSPAPVSDPCTDNENAYERFWFAGFAKQGDYYFGAGLGVYPNRDVMDAHFSIASGGKQHCFHGSRRAPERRSDSTVGPMAVEVVVPLRVIRITIAPNDTGIECDVTFTASSVPLEEPRSSMKVASKVIMDTSRFSQYGSWRGWIVADGKKHIIGDECLGLRDRSWGVRPIGERASRGIKWLSDTPLLDGVRAQAGKRLSSALFKPQGQRGGLVQNWRDMVGLSGLMIGAEPGVYWVWNLNMFDDVMTHFGTFETQSGEPFQLSGALVPRYDNVDDIPADASTGVTHFSDVSHQVQWRQGTRRAQRADITLRGEHGEQHEIVVSDPMIIFHMSALGYEHPDWAHGCWKGEEVIAGESWVTADLDPLQRNTVHTHQICKVKMGDREGVGLFESVVLGAHQPSGFTRYLDGAA